MHEQTLFDNLLLSVKAAKLAGEEIMKIYATNFDVEKKGDNSPLTIADKNAHNSIVETLKDSDLPVLSEEGKEIPFKERSKWKNYWIVDPLDGTKEFIKKNGEFTVNIALMEGKYPIAGVIYVPAKNHLYFGYMGKRAFFTDNPIDADFIGQLLLKCTNLRKVKEDRPFTVVGSRSHMSPETEEFIKQQKKKHKKVKIASMGSSLKICLVAHQKADVYPRFAPTMEWDTAAGQAIAEGARKKVLNYETGERLEYNKKNLLNPWFIVK